MSKKQPPGPAKSARAPKSPRAPQSAPAAKAAHSAQAAVIELDTRMTIVQAADLHRKLSKRLAQADPIVVDGSRVEEIDTAILQLLANLWRSSMQRGIACTWSGASDTLRRTAVLIGVDAMLSLPATESA